MASKSEGVFEQAGTLSFQPIMGTDAQPLVPVSTLVSARLYSSSPTAAQRADTEHALGDAVESITSWADGNEPGEMLVSYSAVVDPNPTTTTRYEVYYWVISYRLTTAGTIINDVESFVIWRPEGITSQYGVESKDIVDVESKLEKWLNPKQRSSKINLAEKLVDIDLRADGKELHRVRKETAKELVQFKAVVLCCDDLSNEAGDSWEMKATRYAKTYDDLFKTIPLGYDFDDDGDVEPDEVGEAAIAVMWR